MAWLKCKKCGNLFIVPDEIMKQKKVLPKCPKCKSTDVQDKDYYNE